MSLDPALAAHAVAAAGDAIVTLDHNAGRRGRGVRDPGGQRMTRRCAWVGSSAQPQAVAVGRLSALSQQAIRER